MYLHMQKDQWPTILEEMFRVLKPGGYIELLEPDFWHHNPGPVQQAFRQFYQEQCKGLNLDLEISHSLAGIIEEKGFHEVEKRILDIPIGEWPSEPGKFVILQHLNSSTDFDCRIKTIWIHKQRNPKDLTEK